MQIVEIHTETLNLTEDQFFKLCAENKELRFERDKHKNIIIMAPTGSETGNTNSELNTEVNIWNRQHRLGYCFDSNTGYTLPDGAVLSPDVSWIPKDKWERIPREYRKKFAPICPDFVIELMSESDLLKKTMEKMEEWIENGCRLGWLINPETRTTFIYKPNLKVVEHPFNKTLSGEDVLVGFELKLDEIILC